MEIGIVAFLRLGGDVSDPVVLNRHMDCDIAVVAVSRRSEGAVLIPAG